MPAEPIFVSLWGGRTAGKSLHHRFGSHIKGFYLCDGGDEVSTYSY